jgi:cysteine desulfuration protein SufE
MGIESKIDELVERFNQFASWEDRYTELIKFGKNLPGLEDQVKEDKYLVKGCQSQVWLVPSFEEGHVRFQADSDALIVKGIISILVHVFDRQKPTDILGTKRDVLKEIGISDHLTMNRTNGLASMYKQIKLYALAFSQINP